METPRAAGPGKMRLAADGQICRCFGFTVDESTAPPAARHHRRSRKYGRRRDTPPIGPLPACRFNSLFLIKMSTI